MKHRYPRWLSVLVVAGLAAAVLSVYAAGDWRGADVDLFHTYALGFWGNLSHPLLPTEYPPLSMLPFSLTLLGPAAWYPDVFAFWMGVIAVLGYLAFRRLASPPQANAYALYVVAAGVATLLFRFDLVPALITVGAVWLMQRGRFSAVYPLLAVATLMKLFPLLLLPVAVIAHWHSHRRRPRSSMEPRGAWGRVLRRNRRRRLRRRQLDRSRPWPQLVRVRPAPPGRGRVRLGDSCSGWGRSSVPRPVPTSASDRSTS